MKIKIKNHQKKRKRKFPPIQTFCSFTSLILQESFFESKNKEDTADISGNVHKKQPILEL